MSGFRFLQRIPAELRSAPRAVTIIVTTTAGYEQSFEAQADFVTEDDEQLQGFSSRIGSTIATAFRDSAPQKAIRFRTTPSRLRLITDVASDIVNEQYPFHRRWAKIMLAMNQKTIDRVHELALELLLECVDICLVNDALFMDAIGTFFFLGRLDLVSSLLCGRYNPPCAVVVRVADGGPGPHLVSCTYELPARLEILFDRQVYRLDDPYQEIVKLAWIFPQLVAYALNWRGHNGRVLLNQYDCGLEPGLAYSHYRMKGFFLIPDPNFVSTQAYATMRRGIDQNYVPWTERIPKAFWRGSSTGSTASPGDWKSLPRVKLCQLGQRHSQTFDFGISGIVQFDDQVAAAIKAAELMRSPLPQHEFQRWKYLVDIDGNTNAWEGLFTKLYTGSPVLKIASNKGYRQWYYDGLKSWHNYIPVDQGMSDLLDKVAWLQRHDEEAKRIGERGRAFAQSLTYEGELERGARTIESALQYFDRIA